MPFRTAGASAVALSPLSIHVNGEPAEDPAVLSEWDYLTNVQVSGATTLQFETFCAETGLESLDGVVSVLQVDSPATGWRALDAKPFDASWTATPTVVVPPGVAGQRLEIQRSIVLGRARPKNSRAVAWQAGSRLVPVIRATIHLEGDAGMFPTEAFSFGAVASMSAAALWELRFDADQLDDHVLGAVRLLINTDHPRANGILRGKDEVAADVLQHDLFQEMLLRVAQEHWGDLRALDRDFTEESVGRVLDDLCRFHLGRSLFRTTEDLRNNRSKLLAQIQERFGYFRTGSSRA